MQARFGAPFEQPHAQTKTWQRHANANHIPPTRFGDGHKGRRCQAAEMTTIRGPWAYALDHSLLLLIGAATGLVWANVDPGSYDRLVRLTHFAVNDIGMAFFFALAAKEVVESTAPGGALHSPRRAGTPLLAAIGGMAGPALIFVGLAIATAQRDLLSGWAIPCARTLPLVTSWRD